MKGDAHLEDRLIQYDVRLQEGSISFPAKMIPVREALDVKQWVLPPEQVELPRGAWSYALTRCTCRRHYQQCDNRLEVCFLLDNAADQAIAGRTARHVSLEEAMRVLRQVNVRGPVDLTIYEPGHSVRGAARLTKHRNVDIMWVTAHPYTHPEQREDKDSRPSGGQCVRLPYHSRSGA